MAQVLQQPATHSVTIHTSTRQPKQIVKYILLYLLVVIGAFISMVPFVWTFLSSGKDITELYRYPPTWWPEHLRFAENYVEIFKVVPFAQ